VPNGAVRHVLAIIDHDDCPILALSRYESGNPRSFLSVSTETMALFVVVNRFWLVECARGCAECPANPPPTRMEKRGPDSFLELAPSMLLVVTPGSAARPRRDQLAAEECRTRASCRRPTAMAISSRPGSGMARGLGGRLELKRQRVHGAVCPPPSAESVGTVTAQVRLMTRQLSCGIRGGRITHKLGVFRLPALEAAGPPAPTSTKKAGFLPPRRNGETPNHIHHRFGPRAAAQACALNHSALAAFDAGPGAKNGFQGMV